MLRRIVVSAIAVFFIAGGVRAAPAHAVQNGKWVRTFCPGEHCFAPGIYAVDALGETPLVVDGSDNKVAPRWSPDGTKLVYVRYVSGIGRLSGSSWNFDGDPGGLTVRR